MLDPVHQEHIHNPDTDPNFLLSYNFVSYQDKDLQKKDQEELCPTRCAWEAPLDVPFFHAEEPPR